MEPIFTKPDLPRYTQRAFPPYRFLPFQPDPARPHPRTDPDGHSYHHEEEYLAQFTPDDWPSCELYLYAIDLFIHGYWWERTKPWKPCGMRPVIKRRAVEPSYRG